MPERTEDGNQQYFYLTTTGRRSGQARKIEIWFTGYQDRYYVISFLFEKGQWVINLRKNPEVSFRVGDQRFKGPAESWIRRSTQRHPGRSRACPIRNTAGVMGLWWN